MEFPFYDPPNTAAIVCCHAFSPDHSIGALKDMICHVGTMRKEKQKMING